MSEYSIADLLPCPFCGERPMLRVNASAYFQWAVWVECKRCHSRTVQIAFGNNGSINPDDCSYTGRSEALRFVSKIWNQRTVL